MLMIGLTVSKPNPPLIPFDCTDVQFVEYFLSLSFMRKELKMRYEAEAMK